MYKQLSVDELLQLNTNFFANLKTLYTRQNFQYFQQFMQKTLEDAQRAYFFDGNKPAFRVQRQPNNGFSLVDEKEKIELCCDQEWISRIHNLLKDVQVMRSITSNRSLFETLLQEYREGKYHEIAGKPYVIYDIETTMWSGIRNQFFEMAYSITTSDELLEDGKLPYRYVDADSAKKYADYLLNFDGRIIWYNSIGFDNPVLLDNIDYGEDALLQLQMKSLDPFLLLRKLTGRRMSLNNVSETFLGIGKTLSSGMEWQQLLLDYKKTGNEKLLTKVKEYCKNDVHITLGVMLYLLHYKNVMLDGNSYEVDERTLLQKGWYHAEEELKLPVGFDF